MFDQLKESVIKAAQEEEERRAKQSSSGKKKKKRSKFQHVAVNAERKVKYDFEASPNYPEQISVSAGDVVFVFESFEDGWSQVKKYSSGNQGVIPSSYLAEIVPDLVAKKSFMSTMSSQIQQRVKVLSFMAVDQFKVKAAAGGQYALKVLKYIVTDMLVPTATRVFLIVSRNESYTTTLSIGVRKIYESVSSSLIHSMSDEELAWYSLQLKEDSDKVKEEKARRKAEIQPPLEDPPAD